MAFQEEGVTQGDIFDQVRDEAAAMVEVARTRDRIFAGNEDKPMKIVIGAAIGGWLIYHFLIQR